MKLAPALAMADLDKKTIAEKGIPGLVLMENAARSVIEACRDWLASGPTCWIFCGPGNNGGDGYALGRLLINHGLEVNLISLGAPRTPDAIKNEQLYRQFGKVISFDDLLSILIRPEPHDLIFDALLGTGTNSPLTGQIAEAVGWINRAQGRVLSLDLPSGIDASTGDELGLSIKAERTVTFQMEMPGHHLHPGKAHRGELICSKISIWEEPLASKFFLLDKQEAKALMPRRDPTAYKQQLGHLGVLAGSPGMMGAAILAGRAALYAGAGLVTLLVPKAELNAGLAAAPELMSQAREVLTPEDLARFDALVIGPGLGRNPQDWAQYADYIAGYPGPVLLDADAFSGLKGIHGLKPERMVLTPHPGEFARISGLEAPKSNGKRIGQALAYAGREQVVLLLKGGPSILANPEGELWINGTGNPGMATAGSGDVLSGIIGAFLARKLSPWNAARLGCWLHGKAGDLEAQSGSQESLTASHLINRLAEAFNSLN
ncbi:MAG: hypothetical protein A2527_05270 [Candidatus Lambdaproteobacteria bacterium RIFOXYD2_FULL_50_16]|uniref:Bifunctional NAD(P)H-hydrate repair enzyme n=1 Tax=Candidatus Lambdaproteobacteria bacterium RIFOXYD2_FULL_50_16 TaxID=1817772 RepID=A0A1F6G8Z2_9PROT|nr:MAG: hypothetical protein A2527_05270 [Candidatus Lambdaproteobacteria bacterium RIFOXYD2_FULL_50_16]